MNVMWPQMVGEWFRPCAAVVFLIPVLAAGCVTSTKAPTISEPETWSSKMTSGFKNSTQKLAEMVTPKPEPAVDNVLHPDKKPGPGVYVAMAELQERLGNVEQAEAQLRKALSLDRNHLGALLAYAHLEDRQRNFQAAERYYKRALKKHSKNAQVYNDMGLCYHRHARLPDAARALSKAVELEPNEKLYRANLAAVLVDQGLDAQALAQLQAAHGQPVGHYNLAYLLVQKQKRDAALYHFRRAAELDPTFSEARQWVAQLSPMPQHVGPAPMHPAYGPPAAALAQRNPQAPYAPGSIGHSGVAPPTAIAGGLPAG